METSTMENQESPRPALPLLVLLALASALGVAVAIALAGVAMLLAAPAYADEGSLLLTRQGGMAEAELVFEEVESHEDGSGVRTRMVAEFYNPFAERLSGVYLYRLPKNAVLERLAFSVLPRDGEESPAPLTAQPALLTLREGAVLIERTAQIGPREVLRVELEYRAWRPRRLLTQR
ncbi:MAG: hypothetical protein ACREVB_05575 [Burkholderiales bacterium]